jgi:lipopolysaccharide transport system ATP-binding protein
MSSTAITIENLGKQYRIGTNWSSYKTLRDTLTSSIVSPFYRAGKILRGQASGAADLDQEFWALRDVSFEVKSGEVLGIIGPNGAGKSTLLKILSHITEPTTGYAEVHGRVGSLLEVGTGFHGELTGRENVYLNGAILGMKKQEIRRKFDEIVAFAEVEAFIDTPLKHYSSGMYMRLAFAVAAHFEPEILIVDEVLSVGDLSFQRKCIGKMGDVAKQGRTILFVSHQMAAVRNLCTSSAILKNGRLIFIGPTEAAVTYYVENMRHTSVIKPIELASFRPSWARELIKSARILGLNEIEQSIFPLGADITFELTFSTQDQAKLKNPVMGVVINHKSFGEIARVNTRMTGFQSNGGPYSSAIMRCSLEKVPFLKGRYTADICLGDGATDLDAIDGYLSFSIEESDFYKTGYTPASSQGVILLEPTWKIIANH